MQVGMGFWASKTLLTAVQMELFTLLAQGELSGQDIGGKLGLHKRSLFGFLDTLVALGFLQRRGIKETSIYRNAEDSGLFLDKNKPGYVGGMLEMSNNRLYPFWQHFEEELKTGLPQNAFGLMMSLNMLVETHEGYDFSATDFDGRTKEIGYAETSVIPLTGPSSAVIAVK